MNVLKSLYQLVSTLKVSESLIVPNNLLTILDRRSLTIGELQWMAYDLLLPALRPMFLNCGLNKSRTDELIKNATVDLYHGNTIFELSSRLYIVNAKRKNI